MFLPISPVSTPRPIAEEGREVAVWCDGKDGGCSSDGFTGTEVKEDDDGGGSCDSGERPDEGALGYTGAVCGRLASTPSKRDELRVRGTRAAPRTVNITIKSKDCVSTRTQR